MFTSSSLTDIHFSLRQFLSSSNCVKLLQIAPNCFLGSQFRPLDFYSDLDLALDSDLDLDRSRFSPLDLYSYLDSDFDSDRLRLLPFEKEPDFSRRTDESDQIFNDEEPVENMVKYS